MAQQLAFVVNLAKCTGCKACQIACKDKNNLPIGIRWRRVLEYSGGEWIKNGNFDIPSNVFTYYVSAACMHCEEPPCRDVCPAKAIEKRDDGVVLIDQTKCIGCRYCDWACPYGAPQFSEELGVMTKCNFCVDLQAKGEHPVCVDACPYRALDFGQLDELRQKYGNLADPAPLPQASITKPAVVYIPHKDTQTSNNATGKMMNLEEL